MQKLLQLFWTNQRQLQSAETLSQRIKVCSNLARSPKFGVLKPRGMTKIKHRTSVPPNMQTAWTLGKGRDLMEAGDTKGEIVHPSVKGFLNSGGYKLPSLRRRGG